MVLIHIDWRFLEMGTGMQVTQVQSLFDEPSSCQYIFWTTAYGHSRGHSLFLWPGSMRTSGVPISFKANFWISLRFPRVHFLKPVPWMCLGTLMICSLVTTSLMAGWPSCNHPSLWEPFWLAQVGKEEQSGMSIHWLGNHTHARMHTHTHVSTHTPYTGRDNFQFILSGCASSFRKCVQDLTKCLDRNDGIVQLEDFTDEKSEAWREEVTCHERRERWNLSQVRSPPLCGLCLRYVLCNMGYKSIHLPWLLSGINETICKHFGKSLVHSTCSVKVSHHYY